MECSLLNDLRYAWRSWAKAPILVASAITTLAIGITTVTTIVTFVNGVYWRPLPYPAADRTLAIAEERPRASTGFSRVEPSTARYLSQLRGRVFEGIALFRERQSVVDAGDGDPRQFTVLAIDTAFERLLGTRAQLGRVLSRDEVLGDAAVVVISDTLWRSRFSADSSVLRRSILVDGRRRAIVGVLPRSWRFPARTDLWVPLSSAQSHDADDAVSVVARLRNDVTRTEADAALAALAAQMRDREPRANKGLRIFTRAEMLDRKSSQILPMPSLFLIAAALVLIVACANVTNLLLARAAERRAEMAIRGCLGASRWRIVRQTLSEGALLGVVSCAAGVLFTMWLVLALKSVLPTHGLPSWLAFEVDWHVLFFVSGLTVVVSLVVGWPLMREGTRVDLTTAVKSGGESGLVRMGVRREGHRGLVVQLALAMVLVVASALMVRSHASLSEVDLGYPADQIATAVINFDHAAYPTADEQMAFVDSLVKRARLIPGARVAASRGFFLEPRVPPRTKPDTPANDTRVFADGDTTISLSRARRIRKLVVSDDYFRALSLPLLRGRSFGPEDGPRTEQVVIVSRRFAEEALIGQPAVGRTIQLGAAGTAYRVIGVAEDVRDIVAGRAGVTAARRFDIYFSERQARAIQPSVLVLANDVAPAMHAAIVKMLRNTDARVDVLPGETLASQISDAQQVTRILGAVMITFAALSMFLAVVGLYGFITYGIAQRRREVAIRQALGATTSGIIAMLVREKIPYVAAGVVIGMLLSVIVAKLLSVFLFGITALDPTAYILATILFVCTALTVSWLGARKAVRISALTALRG